MPVAIPPPPPGLHVYRFTQRITLNGHELFSAQSAAAGLIALTQLG